ncbi:MAG: hypothetical protein CL834_07955 [Crocinitomicaceae bacterium]|nr:hypothetical protein [Crocinitomicaceae bacterium]|tara:strand:+ start:524 stop:1528 length:1005 start_codon:yes stop_codon:yes gene_type:complete
MLLLHPVGQFRFAILGFCGFLLATSCQQTVEVELPEVDDLYVIEGTIFENEPPLVFVGKAQGYFDAVNASSIADSFLPGAEVVLTIEEQVYPLTALCTGELPEELLEEAASLLGFSVELLSMLDLCIYTSLDPNAIGQVGKSHYLDVTVNEQTMTAVTMIPQPVPLDSVWWQTPGTQDSLGVIYGAINDPPDLGDSYRWFAQRTNVRPSWDPLSGQVKDANYVAPLGSAFDDAFFNGLAFEFSVFRGVAAGSTAWDDDFSESPEAGYFKLGDTVAVRLCSIDRAVFQGIRSYENLILSQGSPFALPANMTSNVVGGIGLWAGYGIAQDTVICTE